jgi:hypothetical protein
MQSLYPSVGIFGKLMQRAGHKFHLVPYSEL